jgi:hypothetical protein
MPVMPEAAAAGIALDVVMCRAGFVPGYERRQRPGRLGPVHDRKDDQEHAGDHRQRYQVATLRHRVTSSNQMRK